MAYVPGGAALLNRATKRFGSRGTMGRRLATVTVARPLVWLVLEYFAGALVSGDAHLTSGAILFVVGYLVAAIPVVLCSSGFLWRAATLLALTCASLAAMLGMSSF